MRARGIDIADSYGMLGLDGAGPDTPRLPQRRLGPLGPGVVSALAHGAAALTLALVLGHPTGAGREPSRTSPTEPCVDVSRLVFIASDPRGPGAGGGGGGNRSEAPIRRAEGVGADAVTIRTTPRPTARTAVPSALPPDVPALPSIVIDAAPLASGTSEQIGLPSSGVTSGTSTGPGTGGGTGTGVGTGIGPGQGPGLGSGSGGGTGGGVFRPGGPVTAPRVITEVKPKYTPEALRRRLQGTVELELVVTRDGRPSHIRVVHSLDPGGLDDEAVAAAAQWRFAPGRYGGTPVDVLVTLLLDFWIR